MGLPMTDDERAIRELVNVWLAASRAGDLETVLSLMTDDVIFMVPGQKPFGKEAFAAASQGMQNVSMEGTSDIHELKVARGLGISSKLHRDGGNSAEPSSCAPIRLHADHIAQRIGWPLAARTRRQPSNPGNVIHVTTVAAFNPRRHPVTRGETMPTLQRILFACLGIVGLSW